MHVWPLFEKLVQRHFAPFGLSRIARLRVELVVEGELAEPRLERLRRVPRIVVVAEEEQVAAVVRPRPVGADEAVLAAGRLVQRASVKCCTYEVVERLAAADRVVAGAAVQEVVVPAAEDDVVGVVGVEERSVDVEVPDAGSGRGCTA